jgi:hypothetical protein
MICTRLPCQIKSRWVAPTYTVLLVAGRTHTDDLSELIVAGTTNLVDDNAYRLVEQRIEEGLQVDLPLLDNSKEDFRGAFLYTFEENPPSEQPLHLGPLPELGAESDDDLGDLSDHPF